MPEMKNISGPEELAAFIDGRLGAEETSRVLGSVARERGLFMQFVRAGKGVIGKHPGLPALETAAVKGLVKSSLADFIKRNLVVLVLIDTAIMLVLVAVVLFMFAGGGGKESGPEWKRTVHRGKPPIPGRRTGIQTGASSAPSPSAGTGAGRTESGGAAKKQEPNPEIMKSPEKYFRAYSAAKEDERKKLAGPLALAGAPVLQYLSDAVQKGDLDNTGRAAALEILNEMLKMKSTAAYQIDKLWDILKFVASSDSDDALRQEAMRIAVEGGYPESLNLLRDALLSRNSEDVRAAAVELLAKGPFQKDAGAELLRAFDSDDSDRIKALILTLADSAKIKPEDMAQNAADSLASSSADLKLAAASYLLKHAPADSKALKADIFPALKNLISAAAENRSETADSSEKNPPLTESEKDALAAADLFFKNYDWKRTGEKGNFLPYEDMGSSKEVRRHIIFAFLERKDRQAVRDLISELRAASEDEREFVKLAVEKIASAFSLPPRTADDAKIASQNIAADLISEWWRTSEQNYKDEESKDDSGAPGE